MQIKKSRKTPFLSSPETKRTSEARLAWAVGAQELRRSDPLYHVTEDFRQTFDRIGKEHARTAVGGFLTEGPEGEDGREAQERQGPRERRPAPPGRDPAAQRGRSGQPRTGDLPAALTRFSETAFQRGAMSASVLNGTGKLMLVSCLKRTVGENGPRPVREQALLDAGGRLQGIPGRSPDQMVFNRSLAKGALGIVVDTLRDARRIVASMSDMARGVGGLPGRDSATLFSLYPFLDDSRDAALEAEYRDKLAGCADAREKPVLQNALVQTRSLRAKKGQMKNEFINKLRFVADRAAETLSELEAPGALDEIAAAAFGGEEAELPENPDEGAEGDAPNRKKNGSGEAGRKAAGAGPAGTRP